MHASFSNFGRGREGGTSLLEVGVLPAMVTSIVDHAVGFSMDENDPDMNDFCQRVVSLNDENYFDLDNGSVTDFDGLMSEGAY